MPRGIRHRLHSGVSSIQLLPTDVNLEVLAQPKRVGADSDCGCPGHETHTRTLDPTYPAALASLYPPAHWEHFIESINAVLRSTAVPVWPLSLLVCIPPVPCILRCLCDSNALEREESIQILVEKENERLALQGLAWTEPVFAPTRTCCGLVKTVPRMRGTLTLHLNLQTRAAYELDNPQVVQYLANQLVERSQRIPSTGTAAAAAAGGLTSPSGIDQHTHDPTATPRTNSGVGAAAAAGAGVPHLDGQPLDATQTKLLQRQATLVRKASSMSLRQHSSAAGLSSSAAASPLTGPMSSPSATALANLHDPTRWAQSTTIAHADPIKKQPTFNAVMPDAQQEGELIRPPPPSQQSMA